MVLKIGGIYYCNLTCLKNKKEYLLKEVVYKFDGLNIYNNKRVLKENRIDEKYLTVIDIDIINFLGMENKLNKFKEVTSSDEMRDKKTGKYD